MGVMAFSYTAVLDVTANTLLGNNTGSVAAAQALTASQVRTLCSLYSTSEVDTLLAGKAASSHTHGNITNAGAIGSTSGVPIITGTSGVLQAGSFGSTSGTFCQGNDIRLSDSRTPTAHKTTHATGGSDALTAADIGAAATSHTHAASDITSGTIATARLASGTADATTYLRGDQTWQPFTTGVGGSTGSVDNILLRSDGTGGSTLQSSNWSLPDIYTASPNATVNHLSMQATGSTSNVSVSIVPKGEGSFSFGVPGIGGNARGLSAIDLQLFRHQADAVASGQYSTCIGLENTASGYGAFAAGKRTTASGQYAVCLGIDSTASGYAAFTWGRGLTADRAGLFAFGADAFGVGRLQHIAACMRGTTTDGTTQVELTIPSQSSRLTLVAGTVMFLNLKIIGCRNDGSAVAAYERQYAAKRVGNTTTELQAPVTIGTDITAGTTMTLDADDTNDAVRVRVIGVASQTWTWRVAVLGFEMAY